MKTLTISGLVIAGILFAAGSGVIGRTADETADKKGACCSTEAGETHYATTGTQEKEACGSCCSASSEKTLVTTEAKPEGCSGESCCSAKPAATLVTTDVQEKACDGSSCDASGSCCSEKSEATLVTTDVQEKACDGQGCDASGGCCSEKAETVSTDGDATEGVCPVTLAMSKLPQLVYTVGEQRVCCESMAAELANKESSEVHYVVVDKTFEDKGKAMTALVDSTEAMVNAYISPAKCEVSGNTTIAGKTCSCPVETAQRTKAVEEAVSGVAMKFVVDGQEAACGNCAASRSEATGKPVEFVVAGQSTTCETTARLNLARAKYKAAVEAVVAVENATETAK